MPPKNPTMSNHTDTQDPVEPTQSSFDESEMGAHLMHKSSTFDPVTAKEICERIADGETLISICEDRHMPDRRTVVYWLSKNDAFSHHYARARVVQADSLMDQALHAASQANERDNAQVARVKADIAIRVAAKLNPDKYSERLRMDGELKVQRMTDSELVKRVDYLIQRRSLPDTIEPQGED